MDEDGVEALEVEELLLQPQPTLLYATGEIQSELGMQTGGDMAQAASLQCSEAHSMLVRYHCLVGPIYPTKISTVRFSAKCQFQQGEGYRGISVWHNTDVK